MDTENPRAARDRAVRHPTGPAPTTAAWMGGEGEGEGGDGEEEAYASIIEE